MSINRKSQILSGVFGLCITSIAVIAGAAFIGPSNWAEALALKASPSAPAWQNWREVKDFRKGLPLLLTRSNTEPASLNIQALARQLYSIRVNGLPVCSPDEVGAQQYIYLASIEQKLEGFPNASTQLNALLENPDGITDCQFRILDGATSLPGITKTGGN